MTSRVLIIASAVVVIAVIAAALLVSMHTAAPASGSPGQGGNMALSAAEMQSLFGAGVYNASPVQNATELGQYISSHSAGTNESYLANNVTAYYAAVYNVTSAHISVNGATVSPMVFEQVFASPVSKGIYGAVVDSAGGVLTTVNATSGGMTYSYTQSSALNISMTEMVGQKGGETALVTVIGENVSVQALASTVAADMP